MKNSNYLFLNKYLLLALACAVMVGCKTTRVATKTVLPEINMSAELIEKTEKAQPIFSSANISKMGLSISINEQKYNTAASCKILKDSILHISIQPYMGIELFKAEFSTDSIFVFDKLNKRYYATDYSFLSEKFGIALNFYNLQALISNQLFGIGKKVVSPAEWSLVNSETGNNTLYFKNESVAQKTLISAEHRIENIELNAEDLSYLLKATYSNFIPFGNVNFPQNTLLIITNAKNKLECNLAITKAEFNTDVKITENNRDRYTRGDINQLLKK